MCMSSNLATAAAKAISSNMVLNFQKTKYSENVVPPNKA